MKIPIYKLEFDNSFITKFQEGIEEILSSDSISESKYVRKFESEFAKIVGCNFSVATTSCTDALAISLRAIDVRNKVVLIPSNTFVATAIAIENAGGKIQLLEIEDENFSICPDDLSDKISNEVGAVILVHIGGIISKNFPTIREICVDNGVPLIEDAAHAHGSKLYDEFAGSIGQIGCFSFFPTKPMTTGEGGMICTNDESLYNKMNSMKSFGTELIEGSITWINDQGCHSRISEITGLFGFLECLRYPSRFRQRNKLAKRYIEKLQCSEFDPVLQSGGDCSFYKFILKTEIDTQWLRDYCARENISLTGEVYKIPIHKHPLYQNKYGKVVLPVTEKVCESHICPPLYPELQLSEVDYICEVLRESEKYV